MCKFLALCALLFPFSFGVFAQAPVTARSGKKLLCESLSRPRYADALFPLEGYLQSYFYCGSYRLTGMRNWRRTQPPSADV